MIRPVYTIVFMEKSTSDFKDFSDDYIHTFAQISDTGLDTGAALTEKEAWLAFLSSDEPQVIGLILEQYPKIFRPLYERICNLCRNTAEVMSMFSKELEILDKNTAIMMIEEQKETIEWQQKVIDEKDGIIDQKQGTIDQLKAKDDENQEIIGQLKAKDDENQEIIGQLKAKNDEKQAKIEELQRALETAKKEQRNS